MEIKEHLVLCVGFSKYRYVFEFYLPSRACVFVIFLGPVFPLNLGLNGHSVVDETIECEGPPLNLLETLVLF